jgi:hypothetical protein
MRKEMSMSIRVASRYLRARASLPEDYSLTAKSDESSIKVELKDRWISAGHVHANFEKYTVAEIEGFKCSEDMKKLIDLMPEEIIDMNGEVRVVEVNLSSLRDAYREKGFGVMMYLKAISESLSANRGKPLLFIPNYCHRRSTTPEALRVWKSLARTHQSSGDVLLIS